MNAATIAASALAVLALGTAAYRLLLPRSRSVTSDSSSWGMKAYHARQVRAEAIRERGGF